jgi:hypothetical protein
MVKIEALLGCMTHQHLKSACCRARNIRYGGKRRQCTACRHTWTVRPKRRGRKRIRPSPHLIASYFSRDIANVRTLAKKNGWGRDRAHRILKRSLNQYIISHHTDWLNLMPRGRLIAVADALWHRIDGRKVTAHIILLRPVHESTAIISPPFLLFGSENRIGWERAFEKLPDAILSRIEALVCDGHAALVALGRRRGWRIQRCHFHLIANLQLYLGSRTNPRAIAAVSLVRTLITTLDQKTASRILRHIHAIRIHTSSRGVRRVLGGLQTHYRDFQTYLRYPKLNLPTTTNAAESCMSSIRDIMRQCRGFRSMKTMRQWLTGYLLWKQVIQCNGKYQQKKTD